MIGESDGGLLVSSWTGCRPGNIVKYKRHGSTPVLALTAYKTPFQTMLISCGSGGF